MVANKISFIVFVSCVASLDSNKKHFWEYLTLSWSLFLMMSFSNVESETQQKQVPPELIN